MLAYEELKGSSGRDIWFRAPRYGVRSLFPHQPPRVRVRSTVYKLDNLSLGGAAVVCNQTATDIPELSEVVPLTIQQAGYRLFETNARVCRRENTVFGSKLAFNFTDGYVEFDKLLNRNVQAQIALQSALFNGERIEIVPKDYRIFCADALKLLGSYRELLQESTLIAREFDRGFDVSGAYDACEERLIQHWRSLWRNGNDLAREVLDDPEMLEATKAFTEVVLTPELRLGSIWDRSYSKPLGYPGDFQIMNQVYDWQRIGTTVYPMLLHRLGLEVAECIKTRMDVVQANIANVVREKGPTCVARIMSLGSGPAREVENYLANTVHENKRVAFTLIDQEQAALHYAVEHSFPYLLKAKDGISVRGLNMSFTDILRGTGPISELPPQDAIYSVGLVDYLTDRRARSLIHRLYETLAPGGLLIIGNMNETPMSNLWPMEFVTDWTLYYRSDAEMLAWVDDLQPSKAWTETESTGRVRMLFVRKP